VQAVLAARIDRLPEREKKVLQTAAVIGREFAEPVLKRVADVSDLELAGALVKLSGAEFIYEEALYPQLEYAFKHVLTQEVAYGSLLTDRRQALHERAAQAIEALFGGAEEHYSELAHHYSHSRNNEKAVEYSGLAGRWAAQHSANVEAIRHLTTAINLLEAIPQDRERDRREVTLQVALGGPLVATKGYGAVEVERTYTRARELCGEIGETTLLVPVLFGLRAFHSVRAEHRTARELGEQCLALAQSVQDPGLLIEAGQALGDTLFWRGELSGALDLIERSIALYRREPAGPYAFYYTQGAHPVVSALSYAAMTRWTLGYPDQALERSHAALALAQQLAHPFTLGFAVLFLAWVHLSRREGRPGRDRAEALIALAAEHGHPFWFALGKSFRGWALTELGEDEEGIVEIRTGLDGLRASRSELVQPWFLAHFAGGCGRIGQTAEGLAALTEAIRCANEHEERCYEPELYRFKGELLLKCGDQRSDDAETCFRRAIDIARRQSAKSWELRAVTSLSRLLQKHGKKEEARQMLSDIYGWFTEGSDTADLKDAKALLDDLS
jgi:predicted ATPase